MIQGIHHITAIASQANYTIDFYTQLLGLRLVKKTVNQDDPATYHLFFGDRTGEPGMDLTFFFFQPARRGKTGTGTVSRVAFAIPDSAMSFWEQRLRDKGVMTARQERLGRSLITFTDPDGLALALAASENQSVTIWTTPEISVDHAIRSFDSVDLAVPSLGSIDSVLQQVFGYQLINTEDRWHAFHLVDGQRASLLYASEEPNQMTIPGAGTVHHIAFRAKDEAELLQLRQKVIDTGLYPTEVINRYYFQSVYFQTAAGILFEIATDGPGFTVDEAEAELGEKLVLPPFLESNRQVIESNLPSLK